MAKSSKKPLVDDARKYLASKSVREVERILGRWKGKRRRRGRMLRAFMPWERWEDAMLGKELDPVVARKIGRSLACVHARRRQLGIPRAPNPQLWTAKELALFGTMPDSEIARRTGRGLPGVRMKRRTSGFGPCNPVWKPWKRAEMALLGKMMDEDVARRTGHPRMSVKVMRIKLGRPYFNPQYVALILA
jgi:hypothetical protein